MAGIPKVCPKCGGTRLWRSRSAPGRMLWQLLFIHPVRCGGCNSLYWGFSLSAPPDYKPGPKTKMKLGAVDTVNGLQAAKAAAAAKKREQSQPAGGGADFTVG